MYPSMVVNGKIFRGRLTPDNAFEDICSTFKDLPSTCVAWYVDQEIPLPVGVSRGIDRFTLLAIMIVLSVVSIVVILIYRQWLQNELEKDMQIQVSSAVSQYIALSKIPELNNTSTTRTNVENLELDKE